MRTLLALACVALLSACSAPASLHTQAPADVPPLITASDFVGQLEARGLDITLFAHDLERLSFSSADTVYVIRATYPDTDRGERLFVYVYGDAETARRDSRRLDFRDNRDQPGVYETSRYISHQERYHQRRIQYNRPGPPVYHRDNLVVVRWVPHESFRYSPLMPHLSSLLGAPVR